MWQAYEFLLTNKDKRFHAIIYVYLLYMNILISQKIMNRLGIFYDSSKSISLNVAATTLLSKEFLLSLLVFFLLSLFTFSLFRLHIRIAFSIIGLLISPKLKKSFPFEVLKKYRVIRVDRVDGLLKVLKDKRYDKFTYFLKDIGRNGGHINTMGNINSAIVCTTICLFIYPLDKYITVLPSVFMVVVSLYSSINYLGLLIIEKTVVGFEMELLKVHDE